MLESLWMQRIFRAAVFAWNIKNTNSLQGSSLQGQQAPSQQLRLL
jgi:hypothetical protein